MWFLRKHCRLLVRSHNFGNGTTSFRNDSAPKHGDACESRCLGLWQRAQALERGRHTWGGAGVGTFWLWDLLSESVTSLTLIFLICKMRRLIPIHGDLGKLNDLTYAMCLVCNISTKYHFFNIFFVAHLNITVSNHLKRYIVDYLSCIESGEGFRKRLC